MKIMHKKLFAYIILASLMLQSIPALSAAWFQRPAGVEPAAPVPLVFPTDFQASKNLASPLKKDLAAFEFLSRFPSSANKNFLELMRNKMPMTPEALNQFFSPEELKLKRSWVKLFDNLQFTNEEGKKSIISNLSKTITEAGRVSFLNLVAQENTDIQITKKRQAFIRYFVQNPEQLKKVRKQLSTIKSLEIEQLDRLYDYEKDPIKQLNFKDYIPYVVPIYLNIGLLIVNHLKKENNPLINGIKPFEEFLSEKILGKGAKITPTMQHIVLNGSWFLVPIIIKYLFEIEFVKNFKDFQVRSLGPAICFGLTPLFFGSGIAPKKAMLASSKIFKIFFAIYLTAHEVIKNIVSSAWNLKCPNFFKCPISQETRNLFNGLFKELATEYETFATKPCLGLNRGYLSSIAILPIISLMLWGSKMRYDENKKRFNQANGTASIIKTTHAIHALLKTIAIPGIDVSYDQVFSNFSQIYTNVSSRALSSSQYGPDAQYLPINMILHNTARDGYILENTKGLFEDISKISQFYGEIDAYTAMAQLILDHQATVNDKGEDINCCFTTLVEGTEESMVVAKEMWHPIIPTSIVVTNSISLGDMLENPRNGIITGPNAAGKSASMKTLLVNLILGQTFGVACAKEFKFTPFKKIIARFESADDTANNQSKFMLEASDVVALLKELKALKAGEKAFVVTDELFSGTEVSPAILLSIELCARISKFTNVCYILATHYKDLTQLKEITGNRFENLKVTAFINQAGRVAYPFKLTKGVGDVNIAFDIFLDQMEKQGVRDRDLEMIIENARQRQHLLGKA